ncbi:MAG: adenosylcobinamide-GDP ribazoletransferase [Dehalococcoidales bacterium]|nr:adenosylcobinamide-GDP ribazoletransferase [Dehalococcoidales bacterium]
MSFLAAIRFLTTLRIPRHDGGGPEDLARSAVFFPVVGIIIGLMLAGAYWLLIHILPLSVASGILIVAGVALSGGLHLDGFVDTCDGLGGHKDTATRWQVMHDSRSGAFGIIGVFCLLLVKYGALNSVPDNLMMATLLIMPVLSRWTMVYAIFAYPYARPSGLGKVIKQGLGRSRFALATAVTVAAATGLAGWGGIPLFYLAGPLLMLGVWLITLAMAAYLKGKFGGLTGDTYGAINEVAEVSTLILVCLLVYNHWPGLS